ncbi:hypothetical protein IKQ19_13370 [Candidatus Saccharibacteria bacterium]|nr:hypothetical protein [Candidatus Saccharibacteria bacterium]
MKKIFILSFVAIATLWAETKIEVAVRIDFPNEMFSYDFIDEKSEECAKFFEKHVTTTYGNTCGSGGLCKTALDSNILFGWSYYYCEQSIEYYILSGATHTLRDAIEEDFLHYKNCNGFTGDDSSYNSIFTRIDSILVPEINKRLQDEKKNRILLVYDHRVRQAEIAIPGGGSDLEFIGFASDTVKARNAAISSIAPVTYKLKTIRVQSHRLTASPKLLGRQFTLFDVNGHELRHGTLQNNMQLPTYPTIIKIQGFGTRLLK